MSGATHQTTMTTQNGIAMYTMNEDLARAHTYARLEDARRHAASRNLARATRLSRKAERAAHRARLALARAL